MHMDLNELLDCALTTAVTTGQFVREQWQQPRQLRHKGFRDIVTDADIAAQKMITDRILGRFPDHGFLTEEDDSSLPTQGPIRWVIDPIDGTTNFSRQLPEFSISIAAVDSEQTILIGVVYDPLRDELFRAVKGQGAWLNDRPLQVSQVESLSEALFALDWSRDEALRHLILTRLADIAPHVFTIRAIGTAALAQAWIAAGRIDGYLNLSLSAWDVAAGSLLIQEAGGIVTSGNGRPLQWQDVSSGILASNGRIHQALLGQSDQNHL
jgi:myo-inositol-1(or 4)-monophosphatase